MRGTEKEKDTKTKKKKVPKNNVNKTKVSPGSRGTKRGSFVCVGLCVTQEKR